LHGSLSYYYKRTSSGFLDIGLTGTFNSILDVSGTANLAGTVDVDCVGSCVYAPGTELEILSTDSAGSLTGDFTKLVESGFASTIEFSLLQSNGDEYLVVGAAGAAPAPIPASLWMLLSGLGSIIFVARRRGVPAIAV